MKSIIHYDGFGLNRGWMPAGPRWDHGWPPVVETQNFASLRTGNHTGYTGNHTDCPGGHTGYTGTHTGYPGGRIGCTGNHTGYPGGRIG